MRIGKERNPVWVLILTLVTCHLYTLYFVYKVSQETEAFLGEAEIGVSPIVEVVLSVVTCGLWHIYWDYRMGKRIAAMCQRVGLPVTDNAILYLVLDLIGVGHYAALGLINPLLQQDTLNRIWKAAENRGGAEPSVGHTPRQPRPPMKSK